MTTYLAYTTATPDGDFTVIANDEGILASGWTTHITDLLPLIHATLRPELTHVHTVTHADTTTTTVATTPAHAHMQAAAAALTAYYNGNTHAVTTVPVAQKSGPFRQHAWDVLRTIQPGETVTYTEYANRSGRPAAVRAAASACAMNAAALFVPCHRVLRTDGTLGGFRYGLDIKERLLAREQHTAQ
ncbi:methylated-DNA--[protein]-cysteine S-methyltransferase [Timonella sp. A28]|uniref:methylated-DNA--[protein]-cysteine S-methyltransferase n=1 Tax=Timonella sp. A28 TaxID=3442640 RepID=UPI003EC13E70